MKVVHVKPDKTENISVHGLLPDDTVATACVKLERLLGSDVYLWCKRPVDAHETLAICVAGGVHESGNEYDSGIVRRELASRFGISLTAAQTATPLKTLRQLQKHENLEETVPMRNRYVIPGGYFSDIDVNPYAAEHDAEIGGVYNTADLLLESFGSSVINVATKSDLHGARPQGYTESRWRAKIETYFPRVEDRNLFRWTDQGERQLRDQRRTPLKTEPIITYIPMTGGMPVGQDPGIDRLMNAFASLATNKRRPMVRLQGGGIDRPISRVHDSMATEAVQSLKTPSKREWLQAAFKLDKGSAVLSVFPNGSYKLQIRFGYLEKARIDDVVVYFPLINEVLAEVSPLIRPVRKEHLRPSSSLYIQKPQLMETPSILGGPRNGVYQIITVPLPARCHLEDVSKIIEAKGFPSLKAVNSHAGDFHMQWVRANALRKASVVKNLVYHSATNGGMSPARIDELAEELGLSKRDIADIAQSTFNRHTIMTLVKARLTSDATLTVYVNGNDPEYGVRVGQTMANLLRECGKGRSKGTSDWSGSVSESPNVIMAGVSSASDLDEFYEFFEDDDGFDNYETPTAPEQPTEAAPSASMVANKQKGDILERLKQADPEVFAFPSQPGYVPYSMKCQKNNTSTRQPLVLSPEEAERARKGSTKGMDSALYYRGYTYVCPEKWCPVSGVARALTESCPDPDEPEWTMWNNNYPAFQPGVSHPKGLCMPCCFGSKPKPGLKTWADIQKCKGESDAVVPAKGKAGHINKSDKLLDEGAYGFAPDELFTVDMPAGERPVRRGMGIRAKATLARAICKLLGYSSEGKLRSEIAAELRPEHFIQSDVREFMTEEVAESSASEVRKWMTREYAAIFGLVPAEMTSKQLLIESRVMSAHAECKRRLVSNEEVSDTSMFRFVNSGCLKGANPVMLVELDEAGNAFVEHCPVRAMPKAGRVAVILKRRGVHEPVGIKNRTHFDPWWSVDHPWIRAMFSAIDTVVPVTDTRVVSYSFMAVGGITKSGYLPFARPVFVDPDIKHTHAFNVRRHEPASDEDARTALDRTKNGFYRVTWRDVAFATFRDNERDATLFSPASVDKRIQTMRDLNVRLDASRAITLKLHDELDRAQFERKPSETAKQQIKRLRAEARNKLDVSVPDELLDFAIGTLIRPVPAGVIPSIKPRADERIVRA